MRAITSKLGRMKRIMAVSIGLAAATALPASAGDFVPLNMAMKNYNDSRSNTAARAMAVVGYDATKNNGDHVTGLWNWQTDQVVECPLPSSTAATFAGLADSGDSIFGAGWMAQPQHRAVTWQISGGNTAALSELPMSIPWATQSWATGTSAGHSMVTGAVYGNVPGVGNTRQAVAWRNGNVAELLAVPVGTEVSEARAVTGDGGVAVGYRAVREQGVEYDAPMSAPGPASQAHGMIWTDNGFKEISPSAAGPDYVSLALNSVSGDGKLAAGPGFCLIRALTKGCVADVASGDVAVLDGGDINGDGMVDLLDSHHSALNALSHDAGIIGGSITPLGGTETASLWIRDATGEYEYHDLVQYLGFIGGTGQDGDIADLAGWTLHAITGVSADGMLLSGWGTDPTGAMGIWGATIPEPASITLLAAGLLGLRRRR